MADSRRFADREGTVRRRHGGETCATAQRMPHGGRAHGAPTGQGRRLVVELLDALVRQGLVEDVRPGRTPTTSADPDAGFVQQVMGDPGPAVHRYRNGRALVIGPDRLLAHCLGALSASGVTRVETVLDEGGAVPDGALHTIVHEGIDFALHLFNSTGLSHASALAGVCADRDVPLVQALISESEVLVGPCTTVDWTSVWLRLRPEDRKPFKTEPEPPSGAAGRVLANHMVFQLFRCVTGAAGSGDQRLCSFATRTLETRRHDVLPHLSVRKARPQSWRISTAQSASCGGGRDAPRPSSPHEQCRRSMRVSGPSETWRRTNCHSCRSARRARSLLCLLGPMARWW